MGLRNQRERERGREEEREREMMREREREREEGGREGIQATQLTSMQYCFPKSSGFD